MRTVLALVLLAALTGAFFWEGQAIATLRARNDALRSMEEEARRLADETRDLEQLRTTDSSSRRPAASSELMRLRNEVRQLRAQQQDAAQLRAANERLADELKKGNFGPRRLADVEGAVPREKWSFSGFATPEAAIQSFFTAIASGDPEQFIRCAGPKSTQRMRREMTDNPESFRKDFNEGLAQIGKVSAFRITETRPHESNPERLEVLVQLTVEGEPMPIPLRKIGGEWKIDE